MMQGSSPSASAQGDRVTITGPFAPGKTLAQIGFSLPQAGASTTIRQRWPAALAQVFVGVEKIGAIQVSSPQLTDSREVNTQSGAVFIMGTGGRINANEELVINLSGIPAHSQTLRNVALGLAAIIFGLGAWFAFSPSKTIAAQEAKLRARRDKLMNDVVALERKRRQKPLSASEESKLQRATGELERVVAELDRGEAPAFALSRFGETGARE
jgi:hypothetical protein